MKNHAVEYFHTLVEHEFNRDQYDVSYVNCQYYVTIKLKNSIYSSLSNNLSFMMKKRMINIIKHYLKPEKYCVSVIIEPSTLFKNINLNYPIISEILPYNIRN